MAERLRNITLIFFHILIISVPFFFRFNTEELFEFNKLMLVYGLTVVIVSLWLARMVLTKTWIVSRTALDVPLGIFLLSQLISTVLSIHPRTSLLGYYSRFHGGFLSLIAYTLLYYALISNVKKREYRGLLMSGLLAAGLVSVYAILEHFGHSTSCLLLSGGTTFGVDCWIQDVQHRVFATFGQPNWLAAYVIMLLPLAWTWGTSISENFTRLWQNNTWMRWALWVVTPLLFSTLLFTKSRSGILGFAASVLVIFGGLAFSRFREKKLNLQNQIGLTLLATLASIGLIFGTPYSPSLSEILSPSEQVQEESEPVVPVNRLEQGGTDSGEIRKIVWRGALDVWRRYPLFGSGVETFAYSYYLDRPVEHNNVSEWDFLYNKAHNEFLNFLATSGVVGLGSYVLLLGWFGVISIQRYVKTEDETLLALLAGVVAVSVSNFFGFSTVMVTVLLFIFFAYPTISSRDKRAKEHISPPDAKQNEAAMIGVSLVGVVALILLMRLFSIWKADVAYARGQRLLDSGYIDAGVAELSDAIHRSPNEALYYDELSIRYAEIAVAFSQEGDATSAAELSEAAISASDITLTLNDAHLNFYKTRARVFNTLAQTDIAFLEDAKIALEAAIHRSPTDAKLMYQLGLVELALENEEEAKKWFETALIAKPNYADPQRQLDELLGEESSGSDDTILE